MLPILADFSREAWFNVENPVENVDKVDLLYRIW
jgi:hypothetical protein